MTSSNASKVIVFDVETTGADVERDQIIEIAVKQGIDPQGPLRTLRIKPTISISPEAQAVHGISLEDLKDCRPFSFYAGELHALFEEAEVLIGYNVNFDLSILQAEFRRVGSQPINEGAKLLIDPKRIWQKMEPRGLADAFRRFVGGELAGAHAAANDVQATAQVLLGMLEAFSLHDKSWKDLDALCDLERKSWVGPTAHLQLKRGRTVLGFGKYKWRALSDVAREDQGYLQWLLSSDVPEHVKTACRQELEKSRGQG